MNGTQRRREMLQFAKEQGSLTVSQVASHFGISKMTAHRDMEKLVERGVVRRVFGGIMPLAAEAAPEERLRPAAGSGEAKATCLVCFRAVPQNLFYSLSLVGGEQRVACCPHCGISAHLNLKEQVTMAMATDFLSCKLHPANRSFFVVDSVAAPCCHPSVLAFETQEAATRFQTGFGGKVLRFQETLEELQTQFSLQEQKGEGCPHCSGQG